MLLTDGSTSGFKYVKKRAENTQNLSPEDVSRHTSTDSFLIKSRPFDVKRHKTWDTLSCIILLGVIIFKTMLFWAINYQHSKKKKKRDKDCALYK